MDPVGTIVSRLDGGSDAKEVTALLGGLVE